MGDSPLILIVLKGVLHLFGWLCAIYALPTTAFYGLVKLFINSDDAIDNSRPLHIAVFLFRWAVATLWVPLWLGQSAGLGYLAYS